MYTVPAGSSASFFLSLLWTTATAMDAGALVFITSATANANVVRAGDTSILSEMPPPAPPPEN